ncbi:MAG: ABC transporter ATPase [Rhodocyclaceae bacterium]|nr:ABC transporter ATPase [Rhodocyclaceae bacterium]
MIESVLFCAEKRREIGGGQIELLVDPARVRSSISAAGYSLEQVWKLIGEVRSANFEIETRSMKILGGLIESVVMTKSTRVNPLGGERQLWTVRLGQPLCEMLRLDLPRYYNPGPVARLRHGISQAVARHVLTHQHQPRDGWTLDGLIKAVAGDLAEQARWNARRRLREDAAGLLEIGIHLHEDRVTLPHPPDTLPHPPDACHTRPVVAGSSGTSGRAAG